MNNNVRFRRIAAWLIDYELSSTICGILILAIYFLIKIIKHPVALIVGYLLILVICMVLNFLIFMFRDVLFKGRSVGKRIFGLHILDKSSNEPASIKQKILRNIFFFIYPIDGFVLIATKESLGDKAMNTVVVRYNRYKSNDK